MTNKVIKIVFDDDTSNNKIKKFIKDVNYLIMRDALVAQIQVTEENFLEGFEDETEVGVS